MPTKKNLEEVEQVAYTATKDFKQSWRVYKYDEKGNATSFVDYSAEVVKGEPFTPPAGFVRDESYQQSFLSGKKGMVAFMMPSNTRAILPLEA